MTITPTAEAIVIAVDTETRGLTATSPTGETIAGTGIGMALMEGTPDATEAETVAADGTTENAITGAVGVTK